MVHAGNGPALLNMPDIQLLGITRVMYETTGNETASRKFDSQMGHVTDQSKLKNKLEPTDKVT